MVNKQFSMKKISFADFMDLAIEYKEKFFGAISLFALIYTFDLIENGEFFGFLSNLATFFSFPAYKIIENPLAQIFWIIIFYFLALVLLFFVSFILYILMCYLFVLYKKEKEK